MINNFKFQSHPELRRGDHPITKKAARKLAKICRKYGIRLITEFQCLGHQSWEEETFPLLTKYPQFDLTPGAFPGNKDIYCREWDLMNPEVNTIVFKLLDEIIDAFQVKDTLIVNISLDSHHKILILKWKFCKYFFIIFVERSNL